MDHRDSPLGRGIVSEKLEPVMGLIEFLFLLIVAGICGSIAQAIAGYSHGGCLTSIALGFIGALLGSWLASRLGLPEILSVRFGDQPYPVVWSIIGASLFVAILCLLSGRRRVSVD